MFGDVMQAIGAGVVVVAFDSPETPPTKGVVYHLQVEFLRS
jgi:hypothetical protein